MIQQGKYAKLGAGAAALSLAVASGYVARAALAGGGAVNARPAPVSSGAPASFADIVQRVAPAVVSIDTEGKARVGNITQQGPRGFSFGDPDGGDEDGGLPLDLRRFFQGAPQGLESQEMAPVQGAGSGFFISPNGYIATNNHVIDGADKITVHTADKRTFEAHVVGRDQATDLAVLKVDAANLPYVSFEDSGRPRVGDWVVAVGNPFGLGGTATAGIVSALDRRNVSGSNYVDYMQIDAPINRGNSGGPTFDLSGRVVGVNTAIFSPSGGSVGIGFDIPADVAAQVTHQLMNGGKVARGFIGATVQDVTPEIAESLGIDAKGALVADVSEGGPSQAAGLHSGDVITRIDGHDVADASDLTRRVGLADAGSTLKLDIRRDGKPLQISVHSAARPSEDQLASRDTGSSAAPDEAEKGVLGLRLTPDSRGRGVRVAGVASGSPAADGKLRTGDVIVRAGQSPTHSSGDLAEAVKSARAQGRKQVLLLVDRGDQQTFVAVPVGQG